MPLVVVDTNVSLPATLTPTGLTSKFWMLLVFGAATFRAEHLRLEFDALQAHTAESGAGEAQARLARLATQAEQTRAAMEELLPVGTPSDWVALGGADLFAEYERKVALVSARLGVDPAPNPAAARRQVEAVCVAAEPAFDRARVPTLTRDPDDDLIVWTALTAAADLLISDDKDIVPTGAGGARFYEHGDSGVLAIRFGHFVESHLACVDWAQIDGTTLPRLYRAGSPREDQ